LTYGKTDERYSLVSVPTLVGRKTLGQSPKVSVPTLVGRKTYGLYPDVPTSTKV
jgi:hypothetical protein